MKLLILVMTMILSLGINAQVRDTSNTANLQFHIADSSESTFYTNKFTGIGPWCIGFYTGKNKGAFGEISFCSDSTMTIRGDTSMAVGNMMDWINSVQTRFILAQLVLNRIDLTELAKIAGSKEFTKAVNNYQKAEADEEKRLEKLNQDNNK